MDLNGTWNGTQRTLQGNANPTSFNKFRCTISFSGVRVAVRGRLGGEMSFSCFEICVSSSSMMCDIVVYFVALGYKVEAL